MKSVERNFAKNNIMHQYHLNFQNCGNFQVDTICTLWFQTPGYALYRGLGYALYPKIFTCKKTFNSCNIVIKQIM